MNWGKWGAQLPTDQMARLIEDCCDAGVTSFDQADIYGDHTTEADWGAAFVESGIERERVQLISKCGIMHPSSAQPQIKAKHYDTSQGHIIHSVEASLKNLKTDYLDLLLIHRPSPLLDPREVMKAVEALKAAGKIKHFGVSNFNARQMELISTGVDIEYNQLEISMTARHTFLDGTLDYCMSHKVTPMAWSPLGGGELFSRSADPRVLDRRMRLKAVADKYDWEMDEMAYLFLLHHPSDIKVVTGSSKISRIKTTMESVHTLISDAQWFEIWSAATGVDVP